MRIAPAPNEAHVHVQNKYLQETVYRLETQLQTSHAACRLKDKQIKMLWQQNIQQHKKIGYLSNIVSRMPTLPLACMYSADSSTAHTAQTQQKTVKANKLETEDEWIAVWMNVNKWLQTNLQISFNHDYNFTVLKFKNVLDFVDVFFHKLELFFWFWYV